MDYEFQACSDPKDNKFLDLAYAADAECIISGDVHLREMKHFMGVQIWSPSQFLALELERQKGMAEPYHGRSIWPDHSKGLELKRKDDQ